MSTNGTNGGTPGQQAASRSPAAPSTLTINGHFAPISGEPATEEQHEHGVQVIDEDKQFNRHLSTYLRHRNIIPAGFNYHLISVFGSQSTGKSTLLNHLFGTEFDIMSETERKQTTKGIWMSVNKRDHSDGGTGSEVQKMANNILVMDVEGTDGRERGEDQDFERKSALFALATSEVLIVNIWEHQVGLYQGANMGLLKTVFEVNLQLFLKDKNSTLRSLLFFVIRDHLGTTPLSSLRETLIQDLTRIWTTLSKPKGLENSKIEDYFDFAFAALPHKILQPQRFISEVEKLSTRFREDNRDSKSLGSNDQGLGGGVFLPEYHRRIPADGFSKYAEGVWDQIANNKDLDLPTQQELLAQFRCDEISREVLVTFDEAVSPLEGQQADGVRLGNPTVIAGLGDTMRESRTKAIKDFETEGSRYHNGVFTRKRAELEGKVDARLKALSLGQLSAAHKLGVADFTQAVTAAVKLGQKRGGKGGGYDFAEIVEREKGAAMGKFKSQSEGLRIVGAPWSKYEQELRLFEKELVEVSGRLRGEEMRRLANRVERWVRSRLGESIGLEFNRLGSGRGGSGAPETGEKPATEKDLWDRIWNTFTKTVQEAEVIFTERARSFDASPEEVEVGLWRLRRKSWGVLKAKLEEEVMEGNLLLKLRENFEDKFRYDESGVPRIWRPTDDIEGAYIRARESTLTLIPLLSRFRLSKTSAPPPLSAWVGVPPVSLNQADEEDLVPIGGVDEDEGKSLEEEMTVLSETKSQDLGVRFKKMADGVYVEAKRSAIGGVAQVPLYFYGLLLALGWNEIWAVLRNPIYFLFLIILGIAAYVTYTLNLWGPMLRMANAASQQALEVGKERLREFLDGSEIARRPIVMREKGVDDDDDAISLQSLDGQGRRKHRAASLGDDDNDDI